MERRHLHPCFAQGFEAAAKRRFQRTDVENEPRRSTVRQLQQDAAGSTERRSNDYDGVIEPRGSPVRAVRVLVQRPRRIRDLNFETLGIQEVRKPAAHLAATTDDQRTLPGSATASSAGR